MSILKVKYKDRKADRKALMVEIGAAQGKSVVIAVLAARSKLMST